MTEETASVYRYLPIVPKDKAWGWYVTAAGTHDVPPGRRPFADPHGNQLWKRGRVLSDYAAIYLTRGGGVFQSRETGYLRLEAGDLLLLFPNVWHRFRPSPETGWHEYWVLFNGVQPDRLWEHEIISPRQAVIHVGLASPVGDLFARVIEAVQTQSLVPNRMLAAMTDQILACAVSTETHSGADTGAAPEVFLAKCYLEERLHRSVDMADLAASLNMSYRATHRLFKRSTGLTPHQYHVRLRMSRAKELLEDPRLMVKEISTSVGFEDPYYFSRAFKKLTGCSPEEWRRSVGRGLP